MPQITLIGTQDLFSLPGLAAGFQPAVASTPVGLFYNTNLQGLYLPYMAQSSVSAAVAAGDSVTLINPSATGIWLLNFLSIEISVTGKIQINIDAVDILNLQIVQALTHYVPLPNPGIMAQFVNQTLSIKNVQAVPIDITVNYAYNIYFQ